jgi:hypothetical protein
MAEAYGIPMPDLPDDFVPLECVCLIKCLNEDGNVEYAETRSVNLSRVEAVGMAITYSDGVRDDLICDCQDDE